MEYETLPVAELALPPVLTVLLCPNTQALLASNATIENKEVFFILQI
jgi:hypothetical protein